MTPYASELERAMTHLAGHPDTIFLGQAIAYEGTNMTSTLRGVPAEKKLEMPVCEDMQAGIANGLALAGKVPISIYPRWNFFLLAVNQVVNHLDKLPEISSYRPKVIIRTSVGPVWPWHSQAQHVGDYTAVFRAMLKNVEVVRLDQPEDVFPAYVRALDREDGRSTLLVEWGDFYYAKSPLQPGTDMSPYGALHHEHPLPGLE